MNNILYIGSLPPHPGGSATWGHSLVFGLAAAGFKVHAVAPLAPEPGEVAHARPIQAGLTVSRIPVPSHNIDSHSMVDAQYMAFQRAGFVSEIRPILESGWPDLLLIGGGTYLDGMPGLARSAGIPCICANHALQWAIEKWRRPGDFEPGGLKENLAACDAVIAVAHHSAETLRSLGLTNVAVIPNGVDLERFRPQRPSEELRVKHRIPQMAPVVMHASNLKWLKQPWKFLQAAKLVADRHHDALFLVVGDGPYLDELKQLNQEMGLEDKVRFAGWVAHDLMPDYYALSDMMVLCSELEVAPFVFLEALASGVAIVAPPIAAAHEYLSPDQTAIIVEPNEAPAFADGICRGLDDPALMEGLSRRGRCAAFQFDREDMIQSYASTIKQICRESAARR